MNRVTRNSCKVRGHLRPGTLCSNLSNLSREVQMYMLDSVSAPFTVYAAVVRYLPRPLPYFTGMIWCNAQSPLVFCLCYSLEQISAG